MIRPMPRHVAFAVIACASMMPGSSSAQDAAVVAAIGALNLSLTLTLNTMHSDLANLISQTGSAVNESGAKVAAAIEANGNADRSLAIRQNLDNRVQDAAESFTVPESICAESASGGMHAIARGAAGAAGGLRGGASHASDPKVDQAVNGPAVDPSTDQRRVTSVHARYCDNDDFAAYGGTKACPEISNMPGADKRADTVLVGAGPDGKAPDLTFSTAQIDAARMYTQNSIYRSVGRDLSKGEAATPAGVEYVGLRTQYEAVLDAAATPQREAIAERTPNPDTKDWLEGALSDGSAADYFNKTASPLAKEKHTMSYAELEQFDVGRRYANIDYQSDLQEMSGDNLVREQIRVSALNSWLLLEINRKLQQIAIIQGASLASSGRSEYAPLLQSKLHDVDQTIGRTR